MVQRTFWSILVTEKLQIPPQHLAYYPFARSMTMLLFFFLVMPKLRNMDVRKPMIFGFLGLIVSHVTLISVPAKNYALLLVATLLEACSVPIATTLLEKLVVLVVEAQERARIMAILYVMVMVFTSPFGWIAGRISEIDRSLPFVLNIALFAIGVLLTHLASRSANDRITINETIKEAAEA
jgi:predicted MFS family arabinose efflux permease